MKTTTLIIVLIIALGGGYYFYSSAQSNDSSAVAQTEPVPIKAEIINNDPSSFTIDVEFMENADANTDAEFFAVYVSDEKPSDCGDFRDIDLSYDKPEEHQRRFDLSDHDGVLDAIEQKKCVIIPNKQNA